MPFSPKPSAKDRETMGKDKILELLATVEGNLSNSIFENKKMEQKLDKISQGTKLSLKPTNSLSE